jgi:hypothetical protein
MATCEGCCHLTGAVLNLAAEAADRARIQLRCNNEILSVQVPISPISLSKPRVVRQSGSKYNFFSASAIMPDLHSAARACADYHVRRRNIKNAPSVAARIAIDMSR